ncbi:hypothetical protein QYZ44_17430 [Vibrio parahaemolyticus]|nr:hypothetical protein [Vibrio parahaemolyticus]
MKLNTMKPHLLFVPLAMMLLNGCVSQDYLDHKANADQVQKQMEDARSKNATPLGNVQYLTKPPALATPIKQDKAPKVAPTRSAHQSQSTAVVACALDARARHQCGSVV